MNKKHSQICSFKQLLKNCVSFWFYFTIILNFVVGLVLKIPINLKSVIATWVFLKVHYLAVFLQGDTHDALSIITVPCCKYMRY